MANNKMSVRYLLVPLLFILSSGQIFGQDAPTGHAGVWGNVQSYWELWAQRDLDGYLEYHHAAYSGWSYEDAMHKNKKSTEKWLRHRFASSDVVAYDISAIDIKIHDDVAVVHYYYSILEKNTQNGDEITTKGRKTDFLKKQADKWVIIASHGGGQNKE